MKTNKTPESRLNSSAEDREGQSYERDLSKWTRTLHVKGTSKDLRRASFDELLKIFQKCHDEIWEGGRLDPASAFDEFSRLLMAKIYDERFTPFNEEYDFQVKGIENPKSVAERIKACYEQVIEKNSDVFKVEIKLSDEVIFEVVKILQEISLRSTDLDVKGRAFEVFLGKIFRDEYGQYFTPRNIVRFMVEILDPDEHDVIIDPACGSGGFLLYSLMHVNDRIHKRYRDDEDTLNRIIWDFAHNQVYGIEINDRIARISMMDMVMHEDGHSNIECKNALATYEEFDQRRDIRPGRYSMLLTNPPFGAVLKDGNILRKFELGADRGSQKSEILFIERSLDLLKPGGRLGIVLPNSILTNSTLEYVREFMLRKATVIAIVSLPQHTFVPSGAGVKPSLVFLEKKDGKARAERGVFMAIAKRIGYDARGKEDRNDLGDILDDWQEYVQGGSLFKKTFVVNESELKKSFSPEQYVFYTKHEDWRTSSLSELCDDRVFTGRTPPRDSYTEEGHKILKVRDLTGKGIDWDNENRAHISEDFYIRNQKLGLQENDILFISSAHHPKYIGKKIDILDTIPRRFKEGVMCCAELLVLRVNPKHIDPYYVLLFLNTVEGYEAIQSCIRGQTAHIYPKDIKNVRIPIPPEEELNRIRRELENIREYLMKKGDANEKYLQYLKNAMALMGHT